MAQRHTPSTPNVRQAAARHHDLVSEAPTAAGREDARHHKSDPASPTWAETAARAYAIYAQNGYRDGKDEQNWSEAERQLREGR